MKKYVESEIRSHYQNLTKLLIERQLTITTMESATAGQLASLITDTEGSSAILKGAFVTYSNEAKIRQGVSAEVLDRYTVYSRETSVAMAEACRKAYNADIGIGVTGTMGNADPANPADTVPGEVFYAIAAGDQVISRRVEISPQPTRLLYKLAVAAEVWNVLMSVVRTM